MSEPKIVKHGGGSYLVSDVTDDVDLVHCWHRFNLSSVDLRYDETEFHRAELSEKPTFLGSGTVVWRELEKEACDRDLRS